MKTIKGFIVMDELADNTAGIVAPFGELSTHALTYTREKSYFFGGSTPDVRLVSFSSKDEAGDHYAIPQAPADQMLAIGQWIYDQYTTHLIPSNVDKATFILNLEAQFPSISDTEIGELLEGGDPTYNMPDFIRYKITISSTEYENTLWFSDESFRSQFDEYTVIVIPPHAPIDDINAATAATAPLLASFTAQVATDAAQTVAGDYPPTVIKVVSYVWHDPTAPASTLNAPFGLVIYGKAGDDNDIIKEAIREYIEDHSVLLNWSDVFPDLYAENEFVLIPLWKNIASPETMLDYGIYSPTSRVGASTGIATDLVPDSYAASVTLSTFLNMHLQSSNSVWRSMTFLAVGNPNNGSALFKFTDKFADYMAVPTTDTDFSRMSAHTRNFVLKMNDAFEKARTLTPTSTVPAGYTRTIRDGKFYLAFMYDGTNYLVVSKHTYVAVIV